MALERCGQRVAMIVEHLAGKIATTGGIARPRVTAAALEVLRHHDFPGNVRELENILERAITLAESTEIDVEDLQLTPSAPPTPAGEEDPVRPSNVPLEDYLGEIERQTIVQALEETRWNRTAAAKKLGISFRALRYKLSKLGLE